MPSSHSSRDVVLEQLAADFVERHRQGKHPPLSEYTDRYPDLAADIRDLFPALVQIEKLKPPADATDATDGFERPATPALANLERLGDYRILREVGRGGMGVVYEAEQESLGRHVALKVLPSSALLNPTYLARFRREAQAAGRLHHTNIVPVFGVGECDGVHYYAMQFIQGEGLDKVLADVRRLRRPPGAGEAPPSEGSVAHTLLTGQFNPPMAADPGKPNEHPDSSSLTSRLSPCGPEAEYYRGVARIGVQVADALAYAHRQGILHRDVKPSNLLLDLQGTVWVADFGLAKAEGTEELTHTGDIVGTIRFMAPERFEGESLPQSDVYGLGLTLYELLTLRPAFDDTNKGRLIDRVQHEPPRPPCKLDPRVPRDLETLVLKCLAKDPRERYATAEALAEDLRRFLADRPIHARRHRGRASLALVPPQSLAGRPVGRRPAALAGRGRGFLGVRPALAAGAGLPAPGGRRRAGEAVHGPGRRGAGAALQRPIRAALQEPGGDSGGGPVGPATARSRPRHSTSCATRPLPRCACPTLMTAGHNGRRRVPLPTSPSTRPGRATCKWTRDTPITVGWSTGRNSG